MTEIKKTIVLADDHKMITEGLRLLLERDFAILDAVEDGRSLIRAAVKLQPDVIVADIGMPVLNGIEALRRIATMRLKARVIMLTMHSDPVYISEAIRAGAAGYLLKSSAVLELKVAIQEVLKGRTYLSPRISNIPPIDVSRNDSESPDCLTPRQREVLQLIAEGRSSKEIAAILQISLKTAEFHRHNIMQVLGIHTIAGLTCYAVRHRIIDL
jgi:DNA-binding NarL/FixJ family response regulator